MFLRTLFVLAAALPLSPTSAQQYPARPVRAVVPLTPASGADIAGRIVGHEMHAGDERIDQTIAGFVRRSKEQSGNAAISSAPAASPCRGPSLRRRAAEAGTPQAVPRLHLERTPRVRDECASTAVRRATATRLSAVSEGLPGG